MCFLEYIAYTCGHCSPGVVRPCPLTTARHTNQACALQAQRQFPSPGMCPVCERIVHSRSVISLEWEHRFMHERGLCGCEVVFPGLAGPRNAGALNHVADAEFRAEVEDRQGDGREGLRGGAEGGTTRELSGGSVARAPPLYQAKGRPGEDLRINVRIPSRYSVEWLDDHRQLHRERKCDCEVNFELYEARLALPTPSPRTKRRADDGRVGAEGHATPSAASHHRFKEDADVDESTTQRTRSNNSSASNGNSSSDTPLRDPRVKSKGSVADNTVVAGPMAGPSRGKLSVATTRVANPSVVQSTVTYPYSQASEATWHKLVGARHAVVEKGNVVEPEGKPYAGLPLGAGPEGDEKHTVEYNWDTCPLSRRTHFRAHSLC